MVKTRDIGTQIDEVTVKKDAHGTSVVKILNWLKQRNQNKVNKRGAENLFETLKHLYEMFERTNYQIRKLATRKPLLTG